MTRLKIFMLGQSQITWDDEPLMISRRATRTMLFYLASQRKPVGRSMLCDLFWPENSETEARNKLRGLIAKLRHSLPDPNLLITQNDHVSLDHSKIYVDQHYFTDQFTTLRDVPWHYAEITPLPKPIAQSLVQALSLWKGARFLGDTRLVSTINLDTWLVYTEESLTSLRCLCLERLASHYVKIGETKAAVECLVTLKRYDEGNPNLHHRLISALINGGFRMEAQKSLEGSIAYFEKQLGIPLPDQIAQDRESLQKQLTQAPTALSPHWPKPLPMHLDLVGRQNEINQMHAAYDKRAIIILQGEAGIGKTRLVQEFYEHFCPSSRLLLATCNETIQNMSLQVITDMLRTGINPEEWLALPNLWANFLTLLIPDLTLVKSNLVIPDRPTRSGGEGLIYEAVLNLLKIVSKQHAVLFVLENAQWADTSSLSLVYHLVSHGFFHEHARLLVSYQGEAINPQLQRFLKIVARSEPVETVNLLGLSPLEVEQLTGQVLLRPLSSTLIQRLAEETRGNPYLVLETIKFLNEIPQSADIELNHLPVAQNAQRVVEQKMASLETHSLDFLQVAAVLGDEFDLGIVARVVDQPTKILESSVRQLTRVGLIIPKDGVNSSSKFQFGNSLEQKAISSTIPPETVSDLHEKTATALEQSLQNQVDSQAGTVALHYQRAGKVHESVKWYLRAAKYAWSTFAKAETERIFAEIAGIFEHHPDQVSDDDAFQVFSQQAKFAYESNDHDMLDHICQVCLVWAQKSQSSLLTGTAFHYMGLSAYMRGDYQQSQEYFDIAINHISLTNYTQFLAEIYIKKGLSLIVDQRYQNAIEMLNTALKLIGLSSDPEIMEICFGACFHKSICYYLSGECYQGLIEIETAYDQYQHVLQPYALAEAHHAFSLLLSQLTRYDEAKFHAEEGCRLTSSLGNINIGFHCMVTLAHQEVWQGHIDRGMELAHEVIGQLEQIHHNAIVSRAHAVIGDAYLLLEDFERAEQAFRISTRNPYGSYASHENLARLAFVLAHLGRFDEGESILQSNIEHAQQAGMNGVYLQSLFAQSVIKYFRGEDPIAAYVLNNLMQKAQQSGMIELVMLVKQVQMLIAGRAGELEQFNRIYQELIAFSKESGTPWPFIKITPLWLLHNQDSPQREEYTNDLRRSIDFIEENAQSDKVKPAFEKAKASWLENI